MQPREKRLATILAVVVGLAGAWYVLELVFAPLATQRNQLAAAQSQLEQKESQQLALYRAQSNLRDWRYESLPPNQLTAQREYLEWLRDLARMSGFTEAKPEPGRRRVLPRSNFTEIPVTIEARATLEQVARFLYHCERAALLHRIDELELISPAADGNPLLEVTFKAVGLSLPESEDRQHLFPRAALTSDLSAEATTVDVEPVPGFPLEAGFQIKMGDELARVQHIEGGRWTIERGVEETVAAAHPAGNEIELFPVDPDAAGGAFDDYRSLLENSPFTKPAPPIEYRPQLSPPSLPVVTRGTPWEVPLTVTGWNPSGGPQVFSLGKDAPPGMKIDEETGTLTWNPEESIPAGVFDVTILVTSRVNSDQRLAVMLPVKLREPNLPPTVAKVEPIRAYSGQPIVQQINAVDPDGTDGGLKFSLTGEVPEGAKIDDQSGTLTWTPPLTLELGEYPITVSVTDPGDPPQTVTVTVPITVAEDAALFTKYVGYFGEAGKPEAFLYNQATDEKTNLSPGDSLEIADIKATVERIERDYIELKIATQSFRLPLGKSLRQLLPVGEPAAAITKGAE